ncbi:MAG: carbamoyltransferase HypF [Deferribacterales bacterium]
MSTYKITVRGIVQGVGFRPFIYNLAVSGGLTGSVTNTGEGVIIHVNTDDITALRADILRLAPPLSVITSIDYEQISDMEFSGFTIEHTQNSGGLSFVPPDTAICPACAGEILDPANRRFRYPFTNCTDCGPRYSIIRDMPYDREKTVMDVFKMCPSCQAEYDNPSDRRFHAQPNACPDCGPDVSMDGLTGYAAIERAAGLIDSGEIIAVKGLGGYHLICDAGNSETILKLRDIKKRPDKPLAVMCLPDTINNLNISDDEKRLIMSAEAPIVICECPDADVSEHISPMSSSIGFMTAYTPLHILLIGACRTDFIVATSGNLKDEPIAKDAESAETALSVFTNHFLHHNREIHNRCDDSVAAVAGGAPYILRRARGLAPFPVTLPVSSDRCVMGAGAHLKNTIALSKDGYSFVSQFIGDLDHPDTCLFYEETAEKMKRLYGLEPEIIIHDAHPNYHSTLYAKDSGIKAVPLQHHAAHMFACMAENGLTDNVLGVIMDGTGLAPDRSIWGGEFLLLKNGNMTREAHLPTVAQPGMDGAAKHPARMLISYLFQFGLLEDSMDIVTSRLDIKEKDITMIMSMIDKNINCIQTSSCGRFFESVGALVTGIGTNLFEAHSAMKLEGMCSGSGRDYGCIPPCELLSRVLRDIRTNIPKEETAEAFHNSFAIWMFDRASRICEEHNITDVVLSGGVFQNLKLVRKLNYISDMSIINLHFHKKLSSNDSCISLGQTFFGNFPNFINFLF